METSSKIGLSIAVVALVSSCSTSSSDGANAGAGGAEAGATAGGAPAMAGAATSGAAGAAGTPVVVEPATIPAFPGAEGFGRFARGGRGGSVCHVTNLDDAGPGSLRDCVSRHDRTVVFDVGGWITLTQPLEIGANNLTLAGQTAPGGGIGVRGRTVAIASSNVVVRFMRFRHGVLVTDRSEDSLMVRSFAQHVIVDHCSVGFGIDESFSMPGDDPTGPRNFTVQWTINAYSLQVSNHSAGSLLVGNDTTVHHTLWALNKTRNPRGRTVEGGVLDWVNNVTFGWDARHEYGEMMGWSLSHHPFMLANTGTGMHRANAIGNYFVSLRPAEYAFVAGQANADGVPAFNLYFEGNLLDGNANGVLDVSKDDWSMVQQPATELGERLPTGEVAIDAAETAYELVLAGVGATLPERDAVDALTIEHVRNQTGVLITTEMDLVSEGIGEDGYGVLAPGEAAPDGDGDGMPDAWEEEQGLDPEDAADGAQDADGDGYTHLEDYLNSLVPPNP